MLKGGEGGGRGWQGGQGTAGDDRGWQGGGGKGSINEERERERGGEECCGCKKRIKKGGRKDKEEKEVGKKERKEREDMGE